MKAKMFFLTFILLFFSSASALDVHLFYGLGCPHCSEAIDFMKNQPVNLFTYEIWYNESNREIFENFSNEYKTNFDYSVPKIFPQI